MYDPLPYWQAAQLANKRANDQHKQHIARLNGEAPEQTYPGPTPASSAEQAHTRIDALIEWVQNLAEELSDHPGVPLSSQDLIFNDPCPQPGSRARRRSRREQRTDVAAAYQEDEGEKW
ncbi:hypothetical protein ACFC1R_17105 [Kitasatospora sp. NPDC056138]|uniref:hypothetical protein n=1 Tax=Kitasatospora sp. NPDC056138 TaxID=3345724 RepID=UPI0035DEE80E